MGEWLEETYFIRRRHQGRGSLFYHFNHTDELSSDVHAMSLQLKRHRKRSLLQVVLGLDHGKTIRFETMLRA